MCLKSSAARGEIVKTWLAFAVVITMAVPAAVRAQTRVPVTAEQERRQDEITVLEGTLTSSVSLAATKVAKEVQSSTPNATLFTGRAQARGFLLEGFGVFFSVEIPSLDLNVMLTMETLERNAQLRNDRSQNNSLPQISLPQVNLPQVNLPQVNLPLPQVNDLPQINRSDPQPDSTAKQMIQSVVAADPGQKYRDAVKLALIDAMLDHSKNLELRPDEWFTIAARGSEAGLLPGEIFQLTTVILRVKGSDLADYLAGRLTKEEARKKVEVRQF
jgi:hypothetical protein